MDPACRQKIYCDPTPEQDAGSPAKTLLSTRQSTHQPSLCHPDQVPCTKPTGKNANCGKDTAISCGLKGKKSP